MKTGIVVNNYDPTFKNRCQIRVNGLHTQMVGDQYVSLDDALPWALPGPNPSAGGGFYSIPKEGDMVYVDVIDAYTFFYYGSVDVKGGVKEIFHDNAEDSENIKTIAFSENRNEDGTKDYVKIYFIPEKGLTIECNGNLISMPKYDALEIKTKNGAGFSIDTSSNDITIHTSASVTLDCDNIKLTKDAEDNLILGSKLMEVFNNHKHFTSDGQSSVPIQQITPGDFSNKIKIG